MTEGTTILDITTPLSPIKRRSRTSIKKTRKNKLRK